jgi:hypothetical protein
MILPKVTLLELLGVLTLTGISLAVLVNFKSEVVHTVTWIVATAALLVAAGVGMASQGKRKTVLLAFVAGALIHHNFTNQTSPEYTVIGWAFDRFAGRLALWHLEMAFKQSHLLENLTVPGFHLQRPLLRAGGTKLPRALWRRGREGQEVDSSVVLIVRKPPPFPARAHRGIQSAEDILPHPPLILGDVKKELPVGFEPLSVLKKAA